MELNKYNAVFYKAYLDELTLFSGIALTIEQLIHLASKDHRLGYGILHQDSKAFEESVDLIIKIITDGRYKKFPNYMKTEKYLDKFLVFLKASCKHKKIKCLTTLNDFT